jgi:hypothetical protein
VLGERVFTTTAGRSGAIAENVIKQGSTLTFENFTVVSRAGGRDLVGPAKQLLDFATQQGARTLQFRGTFTNPDLAAKFGMKAGDAFSFSAEATRSGILNFLRRF